MFIGLLITHNNITFSVVSFMAEGQAHRAGDVENEIYYLQMTIIMPSVSHLNIMLPLFV